MAWLASLNASLGIWRGEFEGVLNHQLRLCSQTGNWILTGTEQAEQQAEQTWDKLLQSARNLLATGMSTEQVAQLLGLLDGQMRALQQSPGFIRSSLQL